LENVELNVHTFDFKKTMNGDFAMTRDVFDFEQVVTLSKKGAFYDSGKK
jgi:hypothetical protein